jgi:hypothetical protein
MALYGVFLAEINGSSGFPSILFYSNSFIVAMYGALTGLVHSLPVPTKLLPMIAAKAETR